MQRGQCCSCQQGPACMHVPVHAAAVHLDMVLLRGSNGWSSTIMEPRESALSSWCAAES